MLRQQDAYTMHRKAGGMGSPQGPAAHFLPGATLLVNPALLSTPFHRNPCRILYKAQALYSLCAAAYTPPTPSVAHIHTTFDLSLSLLYVSRKYRRAHEEKADKDRGGCIETQEIMTQTPAQVHTIKHVHTASMKSSAKTCTQTHTHTRSYQPV